MKRLFFFILVLLAGATSFTLFALEDPGYVVIGRGTWSLEMTLSLLIWLIVVGGISFYLVVKCLHYLWRLPMTFLAKLAEKK